MRRSPWFACALGPAALALVLPLSLGLIAARGTPAAGAVQTPRPGDRAMFVSVLNRDGAPVTGLSAADFVVREDGVRREVLTAEKATEPMTLALLVDTSQAARPYIADMRRSLRAFVTRFGARNTIAVSTFGERPSVVSDYTLDVPALQRAVDRVFAASGTGSYLLEAVGDTCRSLAKRDFERASILAITAGGPEFSERQYDEFLPRLRESGAALYVLVFTNQAPDLSDRGQRSREMFVDAATRATGGDRIPLLSSMALDAALARLDAEWTNQYRITYSRPDVLIPPEKIEVSVRRPGLVARGTPVKSRRG
jgi:Ca-activated chloride channel family protein